MISSPSFSDIVLGGVHISVYGVLIALGFLVAYGVSILFARRTTLAIHIDSMLIWTVLPAIVCARALFIFYHLDYFFQ